MEGRRGALLVGAAVVMSALFALRTSEDTPPPLTRGSPAPPFELPRLDGAGGTLSLDQLAGKVVLLNFWATWCEPCEQEMPAMERLYRSLSPRGFELVAVSVDEDAAEVVAFRQRLGLSFPTLLDASQAVAGAYQSFRFPESLLIGRDGVVVERYVGPREWDAQAYADRIGRLLGAD